MSTPSPGDLAPRFLGPRARPRVVATRATEVLAALGEPERLDPVGAWRVLALGAFDVEGSLLEELGVVPMHHEVRRTFDGSLEVSPGIAPARVPATKREAIARVRDVVLQATEEAVRPAHRVAMFLSGGSDSGAVAAALVHAWRGLDRNPNDLIAVHARPPIEAGPGEVTQARATAQALGLGFHLQEFDACPDPFAGCEDYFRANDLPSDDGGFLPARRRLEEIRDLGFDTVLTGDGGDEVFAGWWMRPWRRKTVLATSLALVEHGLRGVARPMRDVVTGRRGAMRRALRAMEVPAWLAERCPSLEEARAYPRTREGLAGPAQRREGSTRAARQAILAAWWHTWGRLLGLSIRCPLLDRRVLDLAVALPQHLFLPQPVERWLLRAAFADDLPAAARTQPKADGDALPVLQREVTSYGRDWIEHYVVGGTLERLGLAPGRHGEALVESARQGSPEAMYRLLAYGTLGAWCRARGI